LNPTSAPSHVLVPPRPNLGPEPWSEAHSSTYLVLEIGLVLAALLLAAYRFLRRRRASRRRPFLPQNHLVAPDDSPGSQLLNLAGQIREALATRLGPSMRARTTEEIAADPQLREALGDKHFDPSIQFLAMADRWKFAPAPENGREKILHDELPGWEAWHRSFLAELPAKK
jgi:hypothetical protein